MLTAPENQDLPGAVAVVPVPAMDPSADAACLRVFRNELAYIHHSLRSLGTPPGDLEDLMQEVFLALRGSWHRCDHSRPLRPYLFGIAFRISAAHRRKHQREVPFGTVDLPDLHADLDGRLLNSQARRLVFAALDRLPLTRRAVLVMHELEDIPVATIASTLSIPLFTVYSRLRKARRELAVSVRRMLKGEAIDESGLLSGGQPDLLPHLCRATASAHL